MTVALVLALLFSRHRCNLPPFLLFSYLENVMKVTNFLSFFPLCSANHGKLVDNFSHKSDGTSLQDPFLFLPLCSVFLSRPPSVLPCSSRHAYPAQAFPKPNFVSQETFCLLDSFFPPFHFGGDNPTITVISGW